MEPTTIKGLGGPRGLLRRLSEDRQDEVLWEAAERVRDMVESEILKRTPDGDTGQLAESVFAVIEDLGERVRIKAGFDEDIAPYAASVNSGSGEWGPRNAPIKAVNGHMRFFWSRLGQYSIHGSPGAPVNKAMKLKEVRGQRGQRIIQRGWESAMDKARRVMKDELREL